MRSPWAVMPLQDAAGAAIRAVSPVDAEVLQAFVRGLSPASRYRRFMVAIRELPADMLLRFIEPAPGREAVLLATVADGSASGQVVGVAQYAAVADPSTCEFAVVVADAYQRRGLGRRLLVELGATAANAGIRRAYADVLADNYAMLGLARKLGFRVRRNPGLGYVLQVSRMLPSAAGELSLSVTAPEDVDLRRSLFHRYARGCG